MKKISTLLAGALLFVAGYSYGQSQRLVLVEEFTGETCGPCAAYNPGFNTILDANSTKIVSIKYQNNIPSTGPNFYQYNTTDISNRTSFYGNNYSPHGFLDGNVWNNNVASFTATLVNNRYAVPSPFDVEVSHTFSPAHDVIYTHTVIRATQALTGMTGLHARVAVTEKNVYGYTSPNGEDEYQHVMRKMLPNGTGTTLPADWAVGDSVVVDESWTITTNANPNIYKPYWPELEVVSFVQNDVNKEIMQTGISHPDAATLYNAAITAATPILNCAATYAPVVTLKNWDGNDLTSVDIEYYFDALTPSTYTWTGTLAAGATQNITLPAIPYPGAGAHTLYTNITSVNGSTDYVNINNNKIQVTGQSVASVTAFSEGFPTTTFPPVDWVRNNPDNSYTWSRSAAGGFAASVGSAKIDFYNSANGQVDELYPLMPLDLTAPLGTPALNFSIAYRQYDASSNDRIEVRVSTDCGTTWTSVYNKSGATLSTTTAATGAFTPTTAAQWRAETVSLAPYVGQGEVLIAFKATSNFGNNAYIDDINVTGVLTGVNEINLGNSLSVFPNPVKDKVTLSGNFDGAKSIVVTVNDLAGKEVLVSQVKNVASREQSFDVSTLAAGTYMMNINVDGVIATKKITVE